MELNQRYQDQVISSPPPPPQWATPLGGGGRYGFSPGMSNQREWMQRLFDNQQA